MENAAGHTFLTAKVDKATATINIELEERFRLGSVSLSFDQLVAQSRRACRSPFELAFTSRPVTAS
eukprot:6277528-Prorocentrum_lima.AAC.1